MRWVKGRQKGEYEKLTLLKGWRWFPFDAHILRIKELGWVGEHTDPVPNKKHHRINLVLRNAKLGGTTYIQDNACRRRLYYFRPDTEWHCVSFAHKGSVYILSIGAAL